MVEKKISLPGLFDRINVCDPLFCDRSYPPFLLSSGDQSHGTHFGSIATTLLKRLFPFLPKLSNLNLRMFPLYNFVMNLFNVLHVTVVFVLL